MRVLLQHLDPLTELGIGGGRRVPVGPRSAPRLPRALVPLHSSAHLDPDCRLIHFDMVHRLLRSLWRRSRDVVDPYRLIPNGGSRYRDSWRSDDVARQMLALSESELRAPDAVAPFRAFRELLPVILNDPALPLPARFLDIGCGVGVYGDLLERYASGRFLYVGADYSEQIIDAARTRAPSRTFEVRDVFDPNAP